MALDESAVSALLDALRVGEGTDLVRELAQWALQQLIEAEATEKIGADLWERDPARVTHRNGHRPRVLSTKAGDLQIAIPKLRKGSFCPELLEPRRRIDQALYAVVMEAYVNGVSTRSVDDLVAAMGVDTGISKSQVSRICEGLDERVGAFRNRTLGHVAFPYVYLDATYINVRDDALGQVVSRAVVIATAVGGRPVVGLARVVPRLRCHGATTATSRSSAGLRFVRAASPLAEPGAPGERNMTFPSAPGSGDRVPRVSDVFSRILAGELPARFVWSDEVCGGFLSINPVRPGHVLLVPRVAVDHWIDLEPPIVAHLGRIAQMVGQSLREIFQTSDVVLLIAGLEISHAHIHLVPADDGTEVRLSDGERSPSEDALDEVQRLILDDLGGRGLQPLG